MQLDFSQDDRTWDNTATILFRSIRKTGDLEDTIEGVKVQKVSFKEQAESNGVYQAGDRGVLIPTRKMLLGEPKPRDQVVIGDDTYTTLTVDPRCWDKAGPQRYRLVVRNLRIHYQLNDLCTIERPQPALNESGAEVENWRPVYTDLVCRLQHKDDALGDQRGMRGFQKSYQVFLERDIWISNKDRVKATIDGATVYLEILGFSNADRIDELPFIDAELRT